MQFKNISVLYMAYNHMTLQLQKCHKENQGRVRLNPSRGRECVGGDVYDALGVSEGGQGHVEVSVSSGSLERFSSAVGE